MVVPKLSREGPLSPLLQDDIFLFVVQGPQTIHIDLNGRRFRLILGACLQDQDGDQAEQDGISDHADSDLKTMDMEFTQCRVFFSVKRSP